jgi:hypothetical protein
VTVPDIGYEIRAALDRRAKDVPERSVEAVRRARYAPRTRRYAPRVAAVGVVAIAGAATLAAVLVLQPSPKTTTRPRLHVTPLAYVGTTPPLTVTWLPEGFHPGPDIPVPVVAGQPPDPGVLPDKTFVQGAGPTEQFIIIAEGQNGEGPVAKLLGVADAHPEAVTTTTSDGRTMKLVDLATAGAGSGSLIYFPVGSSAWAMISGSAGLSNADLLRVAEGITYSGS